MEKRIKLFALCIKLMKFVWMGTKLAKTFRHKRKLRKGCHFGIKNSKTYRNEHTSGSDLNKQLLKSKNESSSNNYTTASAFRSFCLTFAVLRNTKWGKTNPTFLKPIKQACNKPSFFVLLCVWEVPIYTQFININV